MAIGNQDLILLRAAATNAKARSGGVTTIDPDVLLAVLDRLAEAERVPPPSFSPLDVQQFGHHARKMGEVSVTSHPGPGDIRLIADALVVVLEALQHQRPEASADFAGLANVVEDLALIRWRETSGEAALAARDIYAAAHRIAEARPIVPVTGERWPDYEKAVRERDVARQGEAEARTDLVNARRARDEACRARDEVTQELSKMTVDRDAWMTTATKRRDQDQTIDDLRNNILTLGADLNARIVEYRDGIRALVAKAKDLLEDGR